jgi:hypothetical protein
MRLCLLVVVALAACEKRTAWADAKLPDGAVAYDAFSRSKTEAYAVGKHGLTAKWDGKANAVRT